MLCSGDKSCNTIKAYCGNPNIDGTISEINGYDIINFDGHINNCSFYFYNNAAVDPITSINCFYDIDYCYLYAAPGQDNFKEGEFNCELAPKNAKCILDSSSTGSDKTIFNCNANNCSCIGTQCNEININKDTVPPSTIAAIINTDLTTPTPKILTEKNNTIIINAKWSNSHLQIFINIDIDNNNDMIINGKNNYCHDIFLNATFLFGTNSICEWTVYHNDYDIIIYLGKNANILLNNNVILLKESFTYSSIHSMETFEITDNINFNINDSDNLLSPIINNVNNMPKIIGICDDLILNIGSISNLGGRNAIVFEWKFIESIPNNKNEYLLNTMNTINDEFYVIQSNQIDANSTLIVNLTIINWYNGKTQHTFNIYKSFEIIPIITINGPSIYSITNKNYQQNNHINIYADIYVTKDCLISDIETFQYTLKWSVDIVDSFNHDIDMTLLQKYINTKNIESNNDNLMILTSYLSPGYSYKFSVILKCMDQLLCNSTTSASFTMYYEFNHVICSISGGDKIINLNYLTKSQLIDDYLLYLDGKTFTYDPYNVDNKDLLQWKWQCIFTINDTIQNCDNLLSSSQSTESVKYINFSNYATSTFMSDITYKYEFIMNVSDEFGERECMDKYIVLITLKTETDLLKYIPINIYTPSLSINVNNRLRLFVDIYDEYTELFYYTFEWKEKTNLISDTNLIKYNMNKEINGNLILESGILTKGFSYKFEINLKKYEQNGLQIGFGKASINIYVYNGPIIHDSSLIIYPICNHSYLSLLQLMNTTHFVSVSGDTDSLYLPLSYRFIYIYKNRKYLLHDLLLTNSYLFNVLLPIGQFTIKSIVYDSESTFVDDQIQCNINIQNIECLSYKKDIIQAFKYETNSQLLKYIIQSAQIYLNFIENEYDKFGYKCLESLLLDILYILQLNINDIDLCLNDYSLTLAQLFTKYFVISYQYDYNIFYENEYLIYHLISIILDPCNIISNITNTDQLFLSQQAILDGITIIYYKTKINDITNKVNHNLLSQLDFSFILYQFSDSLIEIINNQYSKLSQSIIDLLTKSLYIQQLFQMTDLIPGENVITKSSQFEIVSYRVSGQTSLNVTIHQINVYIDTHIFNINQNNKSCDYGDIQCIVNGIDVIIMTQNTSTITTGNNNNNNNNNNVNVYEKCDEIYETLNASLSNESISITINGDNVNISSLANNISVTFDSNFNDVECVWLDENTGIWRNDGCYTQISIDTNEINCLCNHLTTFSTVHNINFDECQTFLVSIYNNINMHIINSIFIFLFIVIFIYCLYQLLPFCIYFRKRICQFISYKSLMVISCTMFISLMNIIICIQLLLIKDDINNIKFNKYLIFLTFSLLLPLWFWFILFSIITYSWINIYLSSQFINLETKIKLTIYIINIILFLYLISHLILVLINLENKKYLYLHLEIVWTVILFIATIIYIIFSVIMIKIVYKTTVKKKVSIAVYQSQNQYNINNKNENEQEEEESHGLIKKLIIVNCIIITFFIVQIFLSIYFIQNGFKSLNIYWRIFDVLSQFICLIAICFLYHKSFKRMRNEFNIKPLFNNKLLSKRGNNKDNDGDNNNNNNKSQKSEMNAMHSDGMNFRKEEKNKILFETRSIHNKVQSMSGTISTYCGGESCDEMSIHSPNHFSTNTTNINSLTTATLQERNEENISDEC